MLEKILTGLQAFCIALIFYAAIIYHDSFRADGLDENRSGIAGSFRTAEGGEMNLHEYAIEDLKNEILRRYPYRISDLVHPRMSLHFIREKIEQIDHLRIGDTCLFSAKSVEQLNALKEINKTKPEIRNQRGGPDDTWGT